MSSIQQINFLDFIGSSNTSPATQRSFDNDRNFYEQLFTQDSDDTIFVKHREMRKKLCTQPISPCTKNSNNKQSPTKNNYTFDLSQLDHNIGHANSGKQECNKTEAVESALSTSLMDTRSEHSFDEDSQSFDSLSQMSYESNLTCDSNMDKRLHPHNITSPNISDEESSIASFDSMEFLEEEEILQLQRGQYIHKTLSTSEANSDMEKGTNDIQVDKIMSFNAQNQYDHMTAAEMLLKQQITFAAIQEPSSSHRKENLAWSSFKRRELASAQIVSYETHHQVILYDSWRWGSKELSSFQSFQSGRLISIAFEFENKQQLGILSIYALTGSSYSTEEERKNAEKIRNTTTSLMEKTMKQWKHQFPNMCVIVLGDLQETISEGDFDNLGKYRKPKFRNGILNSLGKTHISLAREECSGENYITRFGTSGGRGIDHIMVPEGNPFRQWFSGGDVGSTPVNLYFPSDHAAISCSFTRLGNNNRTDGDETTKFDYKKIFQIKMRQCKNSKVDLELDTSQFKESKNFRNQVKLYSEISKITNNNSHETNDYLGKIEKRIEKLFKELFVHGIEQGTNGERNKLVTINKNQATRLAYITREFNKSIKEVMHKLKLKEESDTVATSGYVRRAVHQGKGFKLFNNLPIPTKLRYMRNFISKRRRKVNSIIKWAKRRQMQRLNKGTVENPDQIFKNLHTLQDADDLNKHGKLIWKEYSHETDERERHVEAINHCITRTKNMKSARSNNDTMNADTEDSKITNHLRLEQILLDTLNNILKDSGCQQPFNIIHDRNALDFLHKNLNSWKFPILHYDGATFNPQSDQEDSQIIKDFSKASVELEKLERKTQRAQSKYKKQNLKYLLAVNNIKSFTQKVLPKGREAPVPHNMIYDKDIKQFRRCKNEREEMRATREYHNRWMSPSKAQEACAFAEIIYDDVLGPRGIKLKPKRIVSMKDINSLVHNGKALPLRIKKEIIRAHGEHIASLFKEPEEDCELFYYPFFLTNANGQMNKEEEFQEDFTKAILKIPGKARHEGFQMAVLGRFGERWRKVLFNISKLMLVMRYIPPELKVISRFPIPKPGKSGEYRPISLCHDLYCFLNAICTNRTSKGIELAKVLHDTITSYRKGKGCTNLVGLEQAFREDCLESGVPASQVDEDEEKFFDRISTEMILAAMRVCGFPNQGFLEFKANCMDEKQVDIITNKGVAKGTFSCGLEQGNPDSPTIANLVILFKHKVWNKVRNLGKDMKDKAKAAIENAYTFFTKDSKDGELLLRMMGYCDDNSKFCANENEDKLIQSTYNHIRDTGDLSIVTKIGRKGSKCEAHFFNLSATKAKNLRECETTAWNFSKDAPSKEKVPIKLCLTPHEKKRYVRLVELDTELSLEEKENLLQRTQHEAHRHLGITSTLTGDTSMTSQKCISKINARINDLNINYMEDEAQTKCINMLCTTMHSYAPLQSNHDLQELQACDNFIISKLHTRRGLSKTDTKNRFFIDEAKGGFGFKSFLEEDVIAVARELEILLNGAETDNRAMRARLAAFRKGVSQSHHRNHIRDAMHKLANYGIYLRDRDDELVNITLDILGRTRKYNPVGGRFYKDGHRSLAGIGKGKEKLLDLAMGNKVELLIRDIIDGNDINSLKKEWDGRKYISFHTISKAIIEARKERFESTSAAFNFWEWVNDGRAKSVPEESNKWKFINMTTLLKDKFGVNECLNMTSTQVQEECKTLMKINPLRCLDWNNVSGPSPVNSHGRMLLEFIDSDSPLIISTDGSHNPSSSGNNATSTSASMVICKLDIKHNESLDDGEWRHRQTIPMLARAAHLPTQIGSSDSDIAHGECLGVILQEETLSGSLPRAVLMDSAAIRSCVMKIRDLENCKNLNRNYIRQTTSGVGKYLAGRLLLAYNKSTKDMEELKTLKDYRPFNLMTAMKYRLKIFNQVAHSWCQQPGVKTVGQREGNWPIEYWDGHETRAFHKVNSHQLNKTGTGIKSPSRYPELIPNLAMLSCNHHADITAGLVTNGSIDTMGNISYVKYRLPTSNLRFFFTWNGAALDKGISKILASIFQLEKVKRMRTKATQGLLWRLQEHSCISWDRVLQHPGWTRTLLGLSNSHTRALYKSSAYRTGAWITNCATVSNTDTTKGIKEIEKIRKLRPCMWCSGQSNPAIQKGMGTQHQHMKGNRLHHFFFCGNQELATARLRLDKLIEHQLNTLMECHSALHGWTGSMQFLMEIEETFLHLQKSNKGRLKPLPEHVVAYRSLEGWSNKFKTSSWEAALTAGHLGLLDVFNCRPHFKDSEMHDEIIGTAEGMFLGIVPNQINTVVHRAIFSKTPGFAQIPPATRHACIAQQQQAWSFVQELLIAKNVTLHRILNVTAAKMEKNWKAEFEIRDDSIADTKKYVKSKQASSIESSGADEQTIKAEKHSDDQESKDPGTSQYSFCRGVTCNADSKVWNTSKNKAPSRIARNLIQCQRCVKHMTALRKGINFFQSINDDKPPEEKQSIINLLSQQSVENPQYEPLVNMLYDTTKNIRHDKAKFKNEPKQGKSVRTTITDADKIFCKVIVTSIQTIKHDEIEHTLTSKSGIADNASTLAEVVHSSKLKLTQKKQLRNRIETEEKAKLHQAYEIDSDSEQEDKKATKLRLSELRIALREPDTLLSGHHLYMAVKEIRKQAPPGIYIASPEALEFLSSAYRNSDWKLFGRTFGSNGVKHSRPHGTYIIPNFSGKSSNGHWSVIVVRKEETGCTAAHIDSLGQAEIRGETFEHIKGIFEGRQNFRWIRTKSLAQTELECGFRVIYAIKEICNGIRQGRSFESCLRAATLEEMRVGEYNAATIRRTGTNIIFGSTDWTISGRESNDPDQRMEKAIVESKEKPSRKRRSRDRKRGRQRDGKRQKSK